MLLFIDGVSMGFRCIMRRVCGAYVNCRYDGILAPPTSINQEKCTDLNINGQTPEGQQSSSYSRAMSRSADQRFRVSFGFPLPLSLDGVIRFVSYRCIGMREYGKAPLRDVDALKSRGCRELKRENTAKRRSCFSDDKMGFDDVWLGLKLEVNM